MATVVVLNGRNRGDWYSIGETPMIFGRDENLLAEILDVCVSRRHMELRMDAKDSSYYAVDMGSRNGIIINGHKVNRYKKLGEGDLMQIGHTLLMFTLSNFKDYRGADAFVKKAEKRYAKLIRELDAAERERAGDKMEHTYAGQEVPKAWATS